MGRFDLISIEEAQKTRRMTIAAIEAVKLGGMRSPDIKVQRAVIAMPLSAETYDERMRSARRLQPVVLDYERTQLRAYKAAIANGLPPAAAALEAERAAKPERDIHERQMRERAKALDRVCDNNHKRKLAIERDAAKKAGYR